MNWSIPNSKSKTKKNQKGQEKIFSANEKKTNLKLKGNTQYIPLIPSDAIYREYLFRFLNHEFQHALEKTLKDLNSLLYFSEGDFFEELETSDSLRVCLQSCLVCLCKNSCYNLCSTKILVQNKEQINFPNDFFTMYEKIYEVVLKTYFRIVHAQTQQHKQIIYNSWLLDIPKMIDFCMIYCIRTDSKDQFTNLKLVQQIISKAILSNPKDYSKDFDDFINILYEDKLPFIHKDIKFLINLSPQAMEKANKNFADPLRSFLIASNKILFEIKDLFNLIQYVYMCFPKKFSQKLATDHQILEDSIRIFIEFVDNSAIWKVTTFEKQFHLNFQDIHRTACECFFMNFKILRQIIQRGDTLTNDYFSRAMTSYSLHCMYLVSEKVNIDYQRIYQRMITTLVKSFDAKELFFLTKAPLKLNFLKLNEDQRKYIQKSYNLIEEMRGKIQQIEEGNSLKIKMKQNIDEFFKKASRPKKQHKIIFNDTYRIQKRQILEKINVQQNEKIDKSFSQLEFSVLSNGSSNAENINKNLELDLSFQELRILKSISDEENSDQSADLYFKQSKVLNENIQDIFESEKNFQSQQKQINLYQQFLGEENDDEDQELQTQRNTYYQHSKPQFGQFMDRLIEREEWICKPKEIFY